jgi:hypothetical protein
VQDVPTSLDVPKFVCTEEIREVGKALSFILSSDSCYILQI